MYISRINENIPQNLLKCGGSYLCEPSLAKHLTIISMWYCNSRTWWLDFETVKIQLVWCWVPIYGESIWLGHMARFFAWYLTHFYALQMKLSKIMIEPIFCSLIHRHMMCLYFCASAAYFSDICVGSIACRLEKNGGAMSVYIMTLGVLAPYRGLGIGKSQLYI